MGENYRWTTMYADFAKVAEEGFAKIAAKFRLVSNIEGSRGALIEAS